jgi:hypothetical protein
VTLALLVAKQKSENYYQPASPALYNSDSRPAREQRMRNRGDALGSHESCWAGGMRGSKGNLLLRSLNTPPPLLAPAPIVSQFERISHLALGRIASRW